MAKEKSDVRRKIDEVRERVDRKTARKRASERITLTDPVEVTNSPVGEDR